MKKVKNAKQLDEQISLLKESDKELKHIISLEWESLKRSVNPIELIKNIWRSRRKK